MLYVLGFFALAFIVLILLGLGMHSLLPEELKDVKKTNTNNINKLKSDKGINADYEFLSYDYKSGAILDEEKQILYVVISEKGKKHKEIYNYNLINIPFDKIIQSEVIIDNQAISQTMRGSQVAGALVGGALTGGIGFLVGGLSAKTKHVDKIKNIDIKLTVNDLQNPIAKINFLNTGGIGSYMSAHNGRSKSHELVKPALVNVEKWQGMFDVILKQQIG